MNATPDPPHPRANWHRRVWNLAWPIMLSNITIPLVSTVDTAIVGHLDGAYLIGGVALGALIFNYIYWGFGFLRMGTTGLIAQAFGAGNFEEVRNILRRAIALALVFGVVCLTLRSQIAEIAFTILDGSPEVEAAATTYFTIRIWAAPAALCNIAITGCLFGLQSMRSALVHQFAINLTNIALSLVLVLQFGQGLEGVAWATVAGQVFGLAVGVALISRALPSTTTPPAWRAVFDGRNLRALMAVNLDIFIRTVSVISATAFLMNTSASLGDQVLAANAVLLVFSTVAAYGLDAYAHAAEALVGEAVGARSKPRLRSAVLVSTLWAVAVAAVISCVLLLFGPFLIDMLTNIEGVRETARTYLVWAALLPVLSVLSFQLDGIFIGATRSAEMRNAMVAALLGFVLVGTWMTQSWGNHGLWLAYVVFMGFRTLGLALYYPRIERGF